MSQFIDDIKAVKTAAGEDLRDGSIKDALIFGSTLSALAVHELTMEAWIARVGTYAFMHTSGNPLITGAAMGVFSGIVETGLTYGTAKSLEVCKNSMWEVTDRFFDNTEEKSIKSTGKKIKDALGNTLLGISLGSPGVMLGEYFRHPDKTYDQNKRTGLRARTALALGNFTLGLTIAGSGWIASKLGTRSVTDGIYDAAHWPYLTASILGTLMAVRVGGHLLKRRGSKVSVQGQAISQLPEGES